MHRELKRETTARRPQASGPNRAGSIASEVSRVNTAGTFQLRATPCFLTNALCDEFIGLEQVGDGLWNIVFYKTLIGRIDERTRIVSGAHEYAYEV